MHKFNKLRTEGKYLAANKLIDSLIKRDPKNGYLYYTKGQLEMLLLKFPKAEWCFSQAYRFNYDRFACISYLKDVHFMMYEDSTAIKKDTIF